MTQPGDAPRQASNAAAIAAALWDSADLVGAARQYERALRETPSDLEALHGLGRVRLAQNDLAAATMLLERALALATALPHQQRGELAQRVQRDLAWSLYRLDRFDLAAEYLASLPEGEGLAAQLRAFGERAPYRLSPEVEEIEVPFLGTDPLPIIPLTVGNQEHPFVLDTGSSQLVVDTSLLGQLDLPNYGTREATFASGQRAPIGHTILPQVLVGDAVIRDVPAEVMDVRRHAPQIYGFVGTNFLQRFHVLAEWDTQMLRLRPRAHEPFKAWRDMTAASFWYLDSHLLLAPARVNEHDTVAYVASGMAGAAFTVPESTVVQAGLATTAGEMEGVGAGGARTLRLVEAERLCLGRWCREAQPGFAGFFPPALEWRYGFRVGVLLAHDFLRQQRWGIDFEHLHFYFE